MTYWAGDLFSIGSSIHAIGVSRFCNASTFGTSGRSSYSSKVESAQHVQCSSLLIPSKSILPRALDRWQCSCVSQSSVAPNASLHEYVCHDVSPSLCSDVLSRLVRASPGQRCLESSDDSLAKQEGHFNAETFPRVSHTIGFILSGTLYIFQCIAAATQLGMNTTWRTLPYTNKVGMYHAKRDY